MRKEDQVLEALKALDPKKDENWTGQGLPQMDALNKLLPEGVEVTRKELHEIVPGFNRQKALEALEQKDGDAPQDPPAEGEGSQAGEDQPGTGAPEGGEDEVDTQSQGAQPGENNAPDQADKQDDEQESPPATSSVLQHVVSKETYNEQIAAQEGVIAANKKAIDSLQKANVQAAKNIELLTRDRDAEFPPLSATEAIQIYQQQQFDQRMARVTGQIGSKKAPIDQAMQRRTGYGHSRPMIGQQVKKN